MRSAATLLYFLLGSLAPAAAQEPGPEGGQEPEAPTLDPEFGGPIIPM